MAKLEKAKLFTHGGSQAVQLPKQFRLPGKEVRVRRFGRGLLLEPVEFDVSTGGLRRWGGTRMCH